MIGASDRVVYLRDGKVEKIEEGKVALENTR